MPLLLLCLSTNHSQCIQVVRAILSKLNLALASLDQASQPKHKAHRLSLSTTTVAMLPWVALVWLVSAPLRTDFHSTILHDKLWDIRRPLHLIQVVKVCQPRRLALV